LLTLNREGKTLELPVTLGKREGGGVSLGVSLGVASGSAPEVGSEGFSAAECLTWVDETYRMAAMANDFGLDLSTEIAENRACMDRDTQRMAQPIPQTWCDNVFKVHCSGLDLLAEIGDAQVTRCEKSLSASLGVDISHNQIWNVCGEQKVFDRYSMRGEASDAETCRTTLLEECGTGIDAVVQGGGATPEQKAFVVCCSADALDNCEMIDSGFQRGPCHAQQLCINRLTGEWLHCSVLK